METVTLRPDRRRLAAPAARRRDAPTRDAARAIEPATITEATALVALGREWTTLFDACGLPHQVFQTFEWLDLWASLYLDRRTRLAIVTGRIEGRLVLVWPLVVRRVLGVRVLTGMGAPLSQYTDALIAPEVDAVALDAVLDHVMALPVDVVSLRRVRDDAALAPLLRRRAGAPTHRQDAPYIDFAGTPSVGAFEARYPGKLRSNRRRRRRRLEERGPITFTRLGPSPEALPLVEAAIRFKREWARRAGLPSLALRDPRFARFFEAACHLGDASPPLRVSVLRCGPDIAGIEISVACKGRLFGHVLAPSPVFAELGVGGIMAELTVLSALEQGFAAIDLLAPADSYKREWTTTVVGVGAYAIARTALGRLYARVWLDWGREATKALAKRMRAIVTRRFASKSDKARNAA